MIVSFMRRSAFLRALVLTMGIFSFLLWLYIILRIVFNHVSVVSPFISRIPSVSFWVLGAFSFVVSFLCMLFYLWVWGPFRRATLVPMAHDGRRL